MVDVTALRYMPVENMYQGWLSKSTEELTGRVPTSLALFEENQSDMSTANSVAGYQAYA